MDITSQTMPENSRVRNARFPHHFDPKGAKHFAVSFLAWPIVIGFVMGVNRVGFAQHLSTIQSVAFWLGLSLIIWTGLYIVTISFVKLWPRDPVPVIMLSVPAALIASIVLKPIVFWYADLAAQIADTQAMPRDAPHFAWTIGYFEAHVTAWSAVIVLWVITNLVWKSVLQRDFYGIGGAQIKQSVQVIALEAPFSQISGAHAISPAVQAFLNRIRQVKLAEIIALSSEDHFVHVHLNERSVMIYGRLSDAIEALKAHGLAGVRVHRSYWVLRSAVAGLCSADNAMTVQLKNGVRFPVSRSYRETVRLAGFIE